MKNIITEKLKYGIGITADYSPLALGTRIFQAESVEVDGKKNDIHPREVAVGIADHSLFSFLEERIQDRIIIDIEKTQQSYSLPITATADTAAVYLQINIPAETTVVIHESLLPKEFLGAIIDINIAPGSNVTYIADQRADDNTFILALRRAFVATDASMKWIDLSLGSEIINSTLYTLLDGKGARGETYGAFFGNGEQLIDITHTSVHRAPHTSSELKTHGALDEKAKGLFRSLIDIRENAPNASGHQKEETLVLSPQAEICSVPDLEIANNEVSCSHGVSTTNIDDESLFYFHSRGMSTETAKQTIVEGHLDAIVDLIQDESLKNDIKATIQNRTRIKQIERLPAGRGRDKN